MIAFRTGGEKGGKMSRLTVNGQPVQFSMDPATPLLWALRDAANLTGTKYGCGVGDCGACMVLVDGQALRSCLITLAEAEGLPAHAQSARYRVE